MMVFSLLIQSDVFSGELGLILSGHDKIVKNLLEAGADHVRWTQQTESGMLSGERSSTFEEGQV